MELRPLCDTSHETSFAVDTLNVLLRCDEAMPGFAVEMLDRVSSFGGQDRNHDDYQSILQWMAELVAAHHFVTWPWAAGATFEHEPTTTKGGSDPEFIAASGAWRLGVEVKCPDLRRHQEERRRNDRQLLARFNQPIVDMSSGGVTLPHDNPIKDYLHHCEKKLASSTMTRRSVRFSSSSGMTSSRSRSPAPGTLVGALHQQQLRQRPRRQAARVPVDGCGSRASPPTPARSRDTERVPADDRDLYLDWGQLGRFRPTLWSCVRMVASCRRNCSTSSRLSLPTRPLAPSTSRPTSPTGSARSARRAVQAPSGGSPGGLRPAAPTVRPILSATSYPRSPGHGAATSAVR